MLDALNEFAASLRNYDVVVGMTLPTQERSHNPKDHRNLPAVTCELSRRLQRMESLTAQEDLNQPLKSYSFQ
jgi:hypothetical protein